MSKQRRRTDLRIKQYRDDTLVPTERRPRPLFYDRDRSPDSGLR